MNREIELLKKILNLEQSRDYDDQAVFGGLDRFLQGQDVSKSLSAICPPGFSYTALIKEKRKDWVDKTLRAISEAPTPKVKRSSPARRKKTASKENPAPASGSSLDSPITVIKGISSAMVAKFAKLGVNKVEDMLYFFPRRHLDYSHKTPISELCIGVDQTILVTVWEAREVKLGGRRGTEAVLGDETGSIRAVWFNQPYLAKKLRTNMQIVLSGKVDLFRDRMVMTSPEWEMMESGDLTHTGRLIPIYPLTQGLYPRTMRKLVKETVEQWAPHLTDYLPPDIKRNCSLIDLTQAIMQAHYPDNAIAQDEARRRIAFDELFLIQLGVLSRKREWQEEKGNPFRTDVPLLKNFLGTLPFSLTKAQRRVLKEISTDLEKPKPMSRLLQGDVGSGKTVIATAALLIAAANGYQGAIMAPTEILAEQHFNSISDLISNTRQLEEEQEYLRTYSSLLSHPFTVALLTGSIKAKEKRKIQQLLGEGKIDLVIGTHALIQGEVEFERLGLVVVDEQHRFGVMQRSRLRQKGFNPHVLVMTATPIPRTLALTLYGDLDLSVLDELPPGRTPIRTKWLEQGQREKAYTFLRRKITEGRQAFIICPLVEESETIEARAATVEYERLSREIFPDLSLGLLHGRMSASQKDEVMRCFRDGEYNILVSTSVVEVGIDVPNAVIMLIEGAERFGLSQLHQFRGRVGRGEYKSFCLLLSETRSHEGRERLQVMEQTQDGFILADEDLRLRGPGEFFGTRQSGLPDLRMARLSDVVLLELARKEALGLFQQDPGLEKPENRPLAEEVARLWKKGNEYS